VLDKEQKDIDDLEQMCKEIEEELCDKGETEKRLNQAIEDIGEEISSTQKILHTREQEYTEMKDFYQEESVDQGSWAEQPSRKNSILKSRSRKVTQDESSKAPAICPGLNDSVTLGTEFKDQSFADFE